ncbi:MAG: TIGR04053 family radical SAM/SPASM domain-containing protein [Actinomycetota bacterium]|nr:TIGR04053 family radical SAM/SPASM domain-containing protein [Actinomycetota bacterium]
MHHEAVRSLRHGTDDRPFIVFWEVTRACGLACAHCRANAIPHRDPRELSTVEARRLIDDLAAYNAPRPILVLTGGDPFERDDLAELVGYASQRGLHVSLSPSVTPRLTAARLAGLRSAGASAVSLSLDGARPETHDGLRGIDGTHRDTLLAAAMVREAGFRLQINTTVHAGNVNELPDLFAWLIGQHVSLWSVFQLVPTGRGATMRPLEADGTEDLLHWLHQIGDLLPIKTTEAPHFRRVAVQRAAATRDGIPLDEAFPPGELRRNLTERTAALIGDRPSQRRRRPPLDVNAGRGIAFVDHTGRVYPSGFLPLDVGDVRELPLSTIYRTSPVLQRLRYLESYTGRCAYCEYRQVCGGSRSRAYAVSGDPYGDDPACIHVPARPVSFSH